jgi:hypothetical protein
MFEMVKNVGKGTVSALPALTQPHSGEYLQSFSFSIGHSLKMSKMSATNVKHYRHNLLHEKSNFELPTFTYQDHEGMDFLALFLLLEASDWHLHFSRVHPSAENNCASCLVLQKELR